LAHNITRFAFICFLKQTLQVTLKDAVCQHSLRFQHAKLGKLIVYEFVRDINFIS